MLFFLAYNVSLMPYHLLRTQRLHMAIHMAAGPSKTFNDIMLIMASQRVRRQPVKLSSQSGLYILSPSKAAALRSIAVNCFQN